MANTPIQVVLNSNDFIAVWDKPPGNNEKDFFANDDAGFAVHKSKLSDQLSAIAHRPANPYTDITYAKVILRRSALAKAHRPTGSLFTKSVAPVVGGGDLGEILVELRPGAVASLTGRIEKAEPKPRMKEKNGKMVPAPTRLRSEVGAIEEITPYTASDKRKFSLSDALGWLSDPRTGGGYLVELFEELPQDAEVLDYSGEKQRLISSFLLGLAENGPGLTAVKVAAGGNAALLLGVRLEDTDANPVIELGPPTGRAKRKAPANRTSMNSDRHAALLSFLDDHPLVRKVTLPPKISKSDVEAAVAPRAGLQGILKKQEGQQYPKLAIVDGGVSDIFNEWIEERWGFLAPDAKELDHGSFIAGLTVSGRLINGITICPELDGCTIVDLDILPKDGYWDTYYQQLLQFFDELGSAVQSLKARTGVRIFNFSLNIIEHASNPGYSLSAQLLDKIAVDNDAVFIISAGNTNRNDARREWPKDTSEALRILASSRNDAIKNPAESFRNLSVAAVNPPHLSGVVPYALSNYSCRGPGLRIGVKPDLAHVGGSGTPVAPHGHGLLSFNADGKLVDACGTSFAAPQVAKLLACLDHLIVGEVPRETLIGLAIHHARLPEIYQHKQLKEIAKDLVGFGIPIDSQAILEGSDSSITLVFSNRMLPGHRLSFGFTWPPSLVKGGKCFGSARLTVISTPPFDHRYGAEFVRVNIDGHLRQQQDDGTFKGRLEPLYLPDNTTGTLFEQGQIRYSFKWSPVKVFEKTFKLGVASSSNWKLEIESLARDGETIPAEGIPFTALLTISDPKGKAPVFNEMRQILQAQGVQMVDIRTAARIRPR